MGKRKTGFTLVEVLIAAVLTTVVVGATLTFYIQGLRIWRQETIKNELNIDVELAIERIRKDLRLSSMCAGGSMAFYPMNSNAYTAISMPVALDDGWVLVYTNGTGTLEYVASQDGDNLLERDNDGKIIWDETVIYHVRTNVPQQLVRTVFKPKNRDATPEEIYAQLEEVVTNETTSAVGELDGEVYSSDVVFENLVILRIVPVHTFYDGYAATLGKEYNFNFGSVIIGPGDHTLRFTLVDTNLWNPNSIGHKLGIDNFTMTASDSVREGEFYLATNHYGHFTYTNSPGNVVVQDMSGVPGYEWSGDRQLTFTPTASATGETWLALNVWNDLWLDTDFDVPGGRWMENTSIKSNEFVSADKGDTWDAVSISGTDIHTSTTNAHTGDLIHVMIYGEETTPGNPSHCHIDLDGHWARVQFAAGMNDSLKIVSAQIRELSSANTTLLKFNGGASNVTIVGGTNAYAWSDWADVVIDKTKTYGVEFRVDTNPANDCMAFWPTTVSTSSWVNFVASTNIYAVSKVEVRYPDAGWFKSGIYDTQMRDPNYNSLKWQHLERNTAGEDYWTNQTTMAGDVDLRVGSGDILSLSDGVWMKPGMGDLEGHYYSGLAVPDVNISTLNRGRYVQYEAIFTPEAGTMNEFTGDLLDVMIDWDGPMGIVGLTMNLAKGPDYGVYSATVDGQALARALKIEMTIFKEVEALDKKRYETRAAIEVVPLNTGK